MSHLQIESLSELWVSSHAILARRTGSRTSKRLLRGHQLYDSKPFLANLSIEPSSPQRFPCNRASAIQRWVENKYGVSVLLIVVPQTFGGLLNFNPHLHMLVSAGGFQESECRWIPLRFDKRELMQMWRLALIAYLWVVLRVRAPRSAVGTEPLRRSLEEQYKREWII